MATGLGTLSTFVILLLGAILIPLAAPYELKPKPAEFVNKCKRKIGLRCGNELNIRLFGRGAPYSNSCCAKLKEIGRECHDAAVTKHLLGKPKDYVKEVFEKSDQVWKHCTRFLKNQKRHSPRV